MMERFRNGVYRQAPGILHRLARPFKSPEKQMKSPGGWYTFFGERWCWVYKRKGLYQATLPGKGDTHEVSTIEALEWLVLNEIIKK